MKSKLIITICGIVFFASALSIAVLYKTDTDAYPGIMKKGYITIGYAVEAPYAFIDSSGGVTGLDPETARIISRKIGISRIQWHQCGFDLLIKELNAGRIDIIAAGMFITPERQKHVTFSFPTFRVTQGLLVPAGNPLRIKAYGDIAAHKNIRIAVLRDSIEKNILSQLKVPQEQILYVPDALSGRLAVESGMAYALALSSPALLWMKKNSPPGNSVIAITHTDENISGHIIHQGGFAFRKKDKTLIKKWNNALASFIGGGKHRKIMSTFGFTEDELPQIEKSAWLK